MKIFDFGGGSRFRIFGKTILSFMKKNLFILFGVILINSLQTLAQINYGVPESSWPEPFGNHRAVLDISKSADVVGLELLWRRHDHNPEDRRFIIVEATSGDTVLGIYLGNFSCMTGRVVV